MEKQIIQEKKQEEIKWGGLLKEFLWMCAGSNKKVLRQCPTDWAKHAGIGGTILFTALMAMLSGGYAIYTVFDDNLIASIFGVFWGLLIFNLDRFIVNTMYSDGKHTISWFELMAGLPRIIIAIFLGIVISTPLEMKIFEGRIKQQIKADNNKREMSINAGANSQDSLQIKDIEYKLSRLDEEEKELKDKLDKAEEELTKELEGTGGSLQKGKGPVYERKLDVKNRYDKELQNWREKNGPERDTLKKERDRISAKKEKREKNREERIEKEDGFCIRYEAFSNIKKENDAVRIIALFIMLLFVIIEIAPTFFKMMIASGPYDDLLRFEMHKAKVIAEKRISDLNDEINTEIQISTEKNRNKLEAEVAANKEVLNRIALAQAELINTAIEEWRKEELEKIAANPSAYIKTNSQGHERKN